MPKSRKTSGLLELPVQCDSNFPYQSLQENLILKDSQFILEREKSVVVNHAVDVLGIFFICECSIFSHISRIRKALKQLYHG